MLNMIIEKTLVTIIAYKSTLSCVFVSAVTVSVEESEILRLDLVS